MQTPTILNLNPAGTAQQSMSASKQADGPSAGTPFKQVLSREVADRSSTNDADKSATKSTDRSQSKQPTADNKVDAKSSEETKDKDSADTSHDAGTPTAGISAELLALVANLNQPKVQTTDAAEIASGGAANVLDAAPAVGTGKEVPFLPAVANEASGKLKPASLTPEDVRIKPGIADGIIETEGELHLAAANIKGKEGLPLTSLATPFAPMQQVAINITQAATGHSTEKLTPQVGTPAWDQALGQKIVWMVAGKEQTASLTLNPPDLGPLQVVLSVSNDQANATFISTHAEVRHALETALPKLREMMGEAGIQLGQASVSSGMSNPHNTPENQSRKTSNSGFGDTNNLGDSAIRSVRNQILTGRQGLVDTFA